MLTAEITSWNQRDSRWSGQRLGTVNGSTIGVYGCYISVYADIASYFGHKITPAELDDIFTNNHWYYNAQNTHDDPANLLADGDLTKAYPDIKYLQTYHYENDPADLAKLQELLKDPSIAVGLEVDFDHDPSDGIQMHFVEAISCDGKTVQIADPWYGSIDDIKKNYGNNPAQVILKFVVYQGPVQETGGLPANYPDIIHNSSQWDSTVAEYFPGQKSQDTNFADLKTKIDAIQKSADDANKASNKAQQDLSDYKKDHPDAPTLGSDTPSVPETPTEPVTPSNQPKPPVDPQLSSDPTSINASSQSKWDKFLQTLQNFFKSL